MSRTEKKRQDSHQLGIRVDDEIIRRLEKLRTVLDVPGRRLATLTEAARYAMIKGIETLDE